MAYSGVLDIDEELIWSKVVKNDVLQDEWSSGLLHYKSFRRSFPRSFPLVRRVHCAIQSHQIQA